MQRTLVVRDLAVYNRFHPMIMIPCLYSQIRRATLLLIFALLAICLTACGQVITKPTPALPTATPTITPTYTPTARATATPAPYTPEPTATPTTSPTPIVHIIGSGETLIAIASRYGVSVSAIQEANGIVDPRLLRINQRLIIPTDAESLLTAGTPTPEPTPLPLEFGPLHFGNDARGNLWALGEVTNPGPEALEGVRIAVALLDESNQPILEDQNQIANELIEPGESSPFGILFQNPPESFTSYLANALQAYPAHLSFYYRDLEAKDIEVESERYYTYIISGVVSNTGPEDAVEVRVTITLYDALRQVIGFRQIEPEHTVIPVGGETTFTTEIIPIGGPVDDVSVSAEGHRIPIATVEP